MSAYPFDEHTTVAIVDDIANPNTPTVDELTAGLDITCHLTKDGLNLDRATDAVSRGKWGQLLKAEDPGRYGFANAELTGKRRTQDDTEPFWDAATYRGATRWLAVRRGVIYGTPWAAGQTVEVLGFRFGKRYTVGSASNQNVTFKVPLYVTLDVDEATVMDGDSETFFLLTEGGGSLLTEGSDHILLETGT